MASGTPYTLRLSASGCDIITAVFTVLERACSQMSPAGRWAESWQVYAYISVRVCGLLYLVRMY